MRKQRFRFDTLDHSLVLRQDIAMIAIQFVISIIYIGSWWTFLLVRTPRVIMGLISNKYRLQIFNSSKAMCMLKADWITRVVTIAFYLLISFGFSVQLPMDFCELIGNDPKDDSFSSCKWQTFGFRLVFMLLFIPIELLMFAVVYRNATDMIFKVELRQLTGVSSIGKQKQDDLGYLMDPNIALTRHSGLGKTSSFAQAVELVEDAPMDASVGQISRPGTPGHLNSPDVEQSQRGMLVGGDSVVEDSPHIPG